MIGNKTRMKSNGLLAAVLAGMVLFASMPVAAQQAYPTAEAAAAALVDAISKNDHAALRVVLGNDWKNFIPTEDIEDKDVDAFLKAWAEVHKIVSNSANTAHLAVGTQEWVLPIPLVEEQGTWRFDTLAAEDEIRTRRIGRNELATIQAVLAYYDAQKEYSRVDRNGDGALEYAQQIISTPGMQNGLYWAVLEGEEPSPLGPLYGEDKQGYDYEGYQYRILTAQGDSAPGGAYNYIINGRLVAGFALVAWPAEYDDSGVMSFIISHDGIIYEKDLGTNSDSTARSMTLFNPDSGWHKVNP